MTNAQHQRLAALREAADRAHAAVGDEGDDAARWAEQARMFAKADAAYRTELAAQLARATAGQPCDLPPAHRTIQLDDGKWLGCALEGSGRDFEKADREGARLECWRRWVRADPAWGERLLELLEK